MIDAGRGGSLERLWRRVKERADRARLEFVFLAIALVWGVAQVFIVPPLQVPDEGDHWFRAWALSDGQFTADLDGTVTLPGVFARTADLYTGLVSDTTVLPPSLEGLPGFTDYEDLFNGPGSPGPIRVVSRAANYGPVGYLPQAAGIAVGRSVGAPPLASFYLARLANLIAAVTLLSFAIRLAPFAKQLFALFALLPMTMFQLASVSCDALTISGAIFFTSLLLWATTRPILRTADIALVIAAACILLNIKPGYEALVLLVLLLRPSQLGGRARYVTFVVATVLATLGVLLITSLLTGAAGRGQTVSGAAEQLLFILDQPLVFLGILWSGLLNDWLKLTLESIGILGWFTVALPTALYLLILFAIAAFFVGMEEKVGLRIRQRVLLAAAGVASFLTIVFALFVFLPTSRADLSLQGRYLAPVWLLLLLSAYGIRFTKWRLSTLSVIGVLLVVMVVNLGTLMSFYGS